MIRSLRPPWRHLVWCWFLAFGVFCFSFSSATPSSLEETCKVHAQNRFQIRAMTYSDDYFYLLSSSGQLFVEEAATFLGNLKRSPPRLHLGEPLADNLFSNLPSFPPSNDNENTGIHFAFTQKPAENTGPSTFLLRRLECTNLGNGGTYSVSLKLRRTCKLCLYSGFQLNGKEAPLKIQEDSITCEPFYWNCPDADKFAHWIFWFNDQRTVYLVQRKASADGESEERKAKWAFAPLPTQFMHTLVLKMPFDSRKDVELGEIDKPQSGLYIEKVGLFVVTKESMMYWLPDPWPSWNDWSTRKEAEKWPIKEFVKLTFCKTDLALSNDTFEKNSAKPEGALKGMNLYVLIAGIVVVVSVMAVFYWKKKKKQQAKEKAIQMLSSVMSSTVHSLNSSFSHLMPKETQVPLTSPLTTSPAPKKIKKKRKKSLKKKAKKKKRKEKCPVKARKSPLARISRATRNVPKCSQVVSPSGASPRSVVSSVLEKSRKKLAFFKRFKRKARNLT